MTTLPLPALVPAVAALLQAAGMPADTCTVEPLPGGRNNRVFRVHGPVQSFLLKRYFWHPDDPRDRLRQEFGFLRFLASRGCRFAAAPLATNPVRHLGLMEFIDGTRLHLAEVGDAEIEQAAEFYRQSNAHPLQDASSVLAPASEACFSIDEHLATTQRRIDRLQQLVVADDLDAAVDRFARTELAPAWHEVRERILAAWPQSADRHAALPPTERCLSPSDFGFHNALRVTDGQLRFVDFEYAGWDDPAKLVCDFANQPDMLLARALSDRFRAAVLAVHPNPEALGRRIAYLEPLYCVKWACICLNDFLSAGRSRHEFTAGATTDHSARRQLQLSRARQMFDRVTPHVSHQS